MLLRGLAALALLATSAFAEEETELRQLNEDNFKASIAHGAWLVEHYSPRCFHCKAFAPTWAALANKKAYHEQLSGFHMAQVNCLAQGDLCNSNNITGYPTISLYADGKEIGEFRGDRGYPILDAWIEAKAQAYARGEPLGDSAPADGEDPENDSKPAQLSRPNPEGKVVEVDEAGLETLKAKGPLFVDFFAPWCSHCKKLRPVFEKLAAAYKGKLNIAAVNCEDHPQLCKRNKITGYPTIKLFEEGQVKVFEQHRTLPLMTTFLNDQVAAVPMQKFHTEDFANMVVADDIFFVYLTSYSTSLQETLQVERAVKQLGLSVPVYKTNDPVFYKNQSVAMPPPTSSLMAFAWHDPMHVAAIALPAKDADLSGFVRRNRYPSYYELTSDNYNEIFQAADRSLVVLGAVRDGIDGNKEREEILKMSKAWKKAGRPFEQPVVFVAAPATNWEKWLRKMIGIHPSDVPALVVIDTLKNEYYDMTIEGERARLAGADAFSVLEGIFQEFLMPKPVESALEWGSRGATLMLFELGQWSAANPFIATLGVTAGVVVLILALARCLGRRPAHRGGYMNEKGGQRLD